MIKYHIQHQADPSLVAETDQFIHIFHGSKLWINLIIICHIIAVIVHWRCKYRCDPEIINSQFFEIIQFFNDSTDVTKTITIRIPERFRINLIYCPFAKICHSSFLLNQSDIHDPISQPVPPSGK